VWLGLTRLTAWKRIAPSSRKPACQVTPSAQRHAIVQSLSPHASWEPWGPPRAAGGAQRPHVQCGRGMRLGSGWPALYLEAVLPRPFPPQCASRPMRRACICMPLHAAPLYKCIHSIITHLGKELRRCVHMRVGRRWVPAGAACGGRRRTHALTKKQNAGPQPEFIVYSLHHQRGNTAEIKPPPCSSERGASPLINRRQPPPCDGPPQARRSRAARARRRPTLFTPRSPRSRRQITPDHHAVPSMSAASASASTSASITGASAAAARGLLVTGPWASEEWTL
jgi:hypothetical protein